MHNNVAIALVGGVFALLTLLHFVADWVFQSHAEAMAKPTNARVRARHCLIYMVICCGSIAYLTPVTKVELLIIAVLLFFSHFFEDTYLPVYVWARYIRKPLEMEVHATLDEFQTFASTALGKILLITIDQIIHLLFLLPVSVIIVLPYYSATAAWVGGFMLILLGGLCLIGAKRLRNP